MPVPEQFLHCLQAAYSVGKRDLLPDKLDDGVSFFPIHLILFQDGPDSPDYSSVSEVFKDERGAFESGIGVAAIACYGRDDLCIQFGFRPEYFGQFILHVFDLKKTQFPTFNRSRDLYVNEPSYHATDYNQYHAPECDGDNTSKFKGSMKQNKDRAQDTKENVKFQKIFQPQIFGHEIIALSCDVKNDTNKDHQGSGNTQTMSERTAWLKPGMLRVIESFGQRSGII